MAFVKLDTGILESTLWIDRAVRDVFITALLMAEPRQVTAPEPTYLVDKIEQSEFVLPVGWYGFVPAAGQGIIRRALVEYSEGMEALRKLSEPDQESRTPDHEGRRMVRVSGGYIILNYIKYREKDHSNAERQARYRARKKDSNAVIVTPVTHADAYADVDKDSLSSAEDLIARIREIGTWREGKSIAAEQQLVEELCHGAKPEEIFNALCRIWKWTESGRFAPRLAMVIQRWDEPKQNWAREEKSNVRPRQESKFARVQRAIREASGELAD